MPRLKSEAATFIAGFNSRSVQLKNLEKGVGLKPVWFADLAAGLVKDVSKLLLKGYLDQQERQAWNDYFQKELIAQMYFPLFVSAHDQYWDAWDYAQSLEAEKVKQLQGFDPTRYSRTLFDKTFPSTATMVITVLVTRPAGVTLPLHLDAFVAGRQATPTGTAGGNYTYTISAGGLSPGPSGLGLELKAS